MTRKAFPKMPRFAPGIYPGTVYMTTSRATYNKAAAYLGSDFRPTGAGCALPADDDRLGRVYVMGVFDNDILTLQHECNHVALDIVDIACFDAHDGRGEPFCYLSEAIFAAFYRRFMKPPGKRLQKGKRAKHQPGPEEKPEEPEAEVVHDAPQKAIRKPRLARA